MTTTLTKTIEDESAFEALCAQIRDHGGFQTDLPPAPPVPFAMVDVALVGPDGPLGAAKGQAVHISARGEVAVTFDDANQKHLLALIRATRDADRSHGQPMWVQYEKLSKPEKIRLARTGGADARRVVLKDRDSSLHLHMLDNPGLNASELAALVRANTLATPALKRIAERGDFVGNPAVLDALVNNPRTPVDVASRLVARLPTGTLRRIARQNKLRDAIVAAARKRLMGGR